MSNPSFVLITPVKNEEATIGTTLQSVVAQTLRPKEWVIVSDRSTDRTDEIIRQYEARHPFIRLVQLHGKAERSFASVVYATEAGAREVQTRDYEFIGLLDADLRLRPDYFETLIGCFTEDPKLGLAGGLVVDMIKGKPRRNRQYLKDVAGATQFFRRECFESLGGLVAIPEGGWDAITCVQARANGFHTRTIPELIVEHLKPRNVSEGNMVRRLWQMGTRDYALGSATCFEIAKCIGRSLEAPILIGAAVRLAGYGWCTVTKRKRNISGDMVSRIRREQMSRIWPAFSKFVRND